MYIICEISIHGVVWNVYKILVICVEFTGCLTLWFTGFLNIEVCLRKLRAHSGSQPDFTRKSRTKWWACGACPCAVYGADSFVSWAVFLPDLLNHGFQQKLVVSCWFAWTVDVGLPAASYGSTQVKGSDTFASWRFLCWTRCRCEICRNEFKGCQFNVRHWGNLRMVPRTLPNQNSSWANYGQP